MGRQSSLSWAEISLTIAVGGILALGVGGFGPRSPLQPSAPPITESLGPLPQCQTIVQDRDPPLNVRNTPQADRHDNIVARLDNGTVLQISAGQAGWLRITQPVEGWVSQTRTFSQCTTAPHPPLPTHQTSPSQRMVAAHDAFQSGRLAEAIAWAQSIPEEDLYYRQAQAEMQIWQRQWQIAAYRYQQMEAARAGQQWSALLEWLPGFPENTFWRDRITPLVKEALQKSAPRRRATGLTSESVPVEAGSGRDTLPDETTGRSRLKG